MCQLACCHLQAEEFVQESGLGNSSDLNLQTRMYIGRELNHCVLGIVQSEDSCMLGETCSHLR